MSIVLPPSPAPAPTRGALADTVRRLTARPDLWRPLVRFDAAERYYTRLVRAEDHEVWLLTWLPGQGTEIHGHGGSRGAFAVAAGELTERSFPPSPQPVRPAPWALPTGAVRGFGPRHVHQVANHGGTPAVSIHAYSPALTTMAYYRHLPDGRLVRERVEPVDA
ncbi:cysteine dioxygenase family protein [Streptomyces capparidis]